jgi:tetraacyldisaccharide 4'-kinase
LPPNKRSADGIWRGRDAPAWLLLPIGQLFFLLAALRRFLFRRGVRTATRLPVPVVVIGNITAGGSGKTPLVLWLVEEFRKLGRRPGVISRGYRGSFDGVRKVSRDGPVSVVGDEPLLIRRRGDCPVFVGRDRVAAGRALLAEHPECDIIICDDGLQHYPLARDAEIVVVDRRGFGNGWPLPAGPLREPISRLRGVDAVVANGWSGDAAFRMTLAGDQFYPLSGESELCTAAEFTDLRLHAVAGIGEPQRFFDHLASLGLRFDAHPLPDHHAYVPGDLDFDGDAILTTEKDAVKFGELATLPVWVLPVHATVKTYLAPNPAPNLAQFILEKIDGRPTA